MTEKTISILFAIYMACATVVFGYSYNADYEPETTQFDRGRNWMRAVFSAMFWPGYLSIKAFEGVRK